MMRINLLAEGARDEMQSPVDESASRFQARVFAVAFVAAAMLLGAAWWLLGGWQTRLDSQLAAARSEASRLAGIGAENKRYESELQDIKRRIAAVELLETNRRGPAEFMISLEQAVNRAPGLYLISAGPKDGRLTLAGAAASVGSIADLVTALETSEGFRDVSLREYHEDDDKDGHVRFKYSLDFSFQVPASGAAAPAPASGLKPAPASPATSPRASTEKRHG